MILFAENTRGDQWLVGDNFRLKIVTYDDKQTRDRFAESVNGYSVDFAGRFYTLYPDQGTPSHTKMRNACKWLKSYLISQNPWSKGTPGQGQRALIDTGDIILDAIFDHTFQENVKRWMPIP